MGQFYSFFPSLLAFFIFFSAMQPLQDINFIIFLFCQVKSHPELSAPVVGKKYLFCLCDLLWAWAAAFFLAGHKNGHVQHRPSVVSYWLLTDFLKDFMKGALPLFLGAGGGWWVALAAGAPLHLSPITQQLCWEMMWVAGRMMHHI